MTVTVYAQKTQVLVSANQQVILGKLQVINLLNAETIKQQAYKIAALNKWPVFKIEHNGTIISLQGIDDLGLPLYLKTFNNASSASTTKTNSLYAGESLGLNINGSGNNLIGKVGIWDGGSILQSHQEFAGGKIETKDNIANLSQHSTHVAGTLVATGIYPVARGMAWGLKKLYAYDFNNDNSEMSAAASAGMLISNHSYGYIAGWNYNGSLDRWEWYGAFGKTEDYKFGFYDMIAKSWDEICFNAPYYLPVKSAGNNQDENGPEVGQPYYGFDSNNMLVSMGNRPAGINDNNGYDIIPTSGTAKNILTVGAIKGSAFGYEDSSQIKIAPFSSLGPTDDGRIKPDIVGAGVNVISTSNSNENSYTILSGTSMSAPNVSGSLILLQEYYAQLNQGAFMRSATLKGLVIHTTDAAGNTEGPDYIFGWGLLNTERAAQLIQLKGNKSIIQENNLADNTSFNLNVITSGYGPLKVTICWTDPEGNILPSGTLNSRTPKLVNDLDLRVSGNGYTFLPWKLNPDTPEAGAIKADNNVDNVEQILISKSVPGQVYTIKVNHKGTLTKGAQNFSLIVSGVGGNVYCASGSLDTNGGIIDQFNLNTINNILQNTCRSYSDFKSLSTNLEPGRSYPFSINTGSCGNNTNTIAKVFIDWNSDGDFTDSNETIAESQILSGADTFSGTIAVPLNVVTGNSSLLRIVLQETSSASQISSCGIYSKGETQDYLLNFVKPIIDIGVIAILNPEDGACPNPQQPITLKIRNTGTSTLSNIPIKVDVSDGTSIIATLNGTYTDSIKPLHEDDFTFAQSFITLPGKTYNISAQTALSQDLIFTNNTKDINFNVAIPPSPLFLSASVCESANQTYQLNGEADGTIYWYKDQTDSVPVAIGPSTTTVTPQNSGTFYVGINNFSAHLGPVNKQQFNTGSYDDQFGPKPVITVAAPMVLDSALLYTSKAGQLIFTVETTSGVILNSVTVNVIKSKPSEGNGEDMNDVGKMYRIGLLFPEKGSYRIGIAYNGATIYRSLNATGYPFAVGNDIVSLTGAYTEDSSGPSVLTNRYYYFYNMLFKAAGCTDFIKTPVSISIPEITQDGSSLVSNITANNQWYFNDDLITGAISKDYTPRISGKYKVVTTYPTGCTSSSELFSYIAGQSNSDDIELQVYPVPTLGVLNLNFYVANKSDISIKLLDLIGKELYLKKRNAFLGNYVDELNFTSLKQGIYLLNITIGSKAYTQKIVITK